MRFLNKKWKDYKAELKAKHFDRTKPKREISKNAPPGVIKHQWLSLVEFLYSDVAKKREKLAKESRAKQKCTHASGSKSFARKEKKIIPVNKKNKKESYQEELEECLISLIASLFGGIVRGSRRDRLLRKFVENECEKIDHLMELYMRYSDRVKAETERLDQLELDDLEMDDEESYNRKLEDGLYTLQLIAVIAGHLWSSEHPRISNLNNIKLARLMDPESSGVRYTSASSNRSTNS